MVPHDAVSQMGSGLPMHMAQMAPQHGMMAPWMAGANPTNGAAVAHPAASYMMMPQQPQAGGPAAAATQGAHPGAPSANAAMGSMAVAPGFPGMQQFGFAGVPNPNHQMQPHHNAQFNLQSQQQHPMMAAVMTPTMQQHHQYQQHPMPPFGRGTSASHASVHPSPSGSPPQGGPQNGGGGGGGNLAHCA